MGPQFLTSVGWRDKRSNGKRNVGSIETNGPSVLGFGSLDQARTRTYFKLFVVQTST